MAVYQGKRRMQLNLAKSTGQDKRLLQTIILMYTYILYLRDGGTILMTPRISPPISTTTAGELLKSLTLYNDINFVLQLMG